MFEKSIWNCEIASNSQLLFSAAESSFLRVPHAVGAGKTFAVSGGWYGNNPFSHSCAGGPRYTPTLNSGEACRAALVLRFAAGRTLAVRRRILPNMPPPTAAQRHQAPPSRRPGTGRSVRHWQKGTPVLSVIRRSPAGLWRRLPIVASHWSQFVCLTWSRDPQQTCCCNAYCSLQYLVIWIIASQYNATFATFAIFAFSVSHCFALVHTSCFARFANTRFTGFRKYKFARFRKYVFRFARFRKFSKVFAMGSLLKGGARSRWRRTGAAWCRVDRDSFTASDWAS